MKTNGWFMEASHKIAEILMKNNVPIINDEEKVKKADFVIENNGRQLIIPQILKIHNDLLSL